MKQSTAKKSVEVASAKGKKKKVTSVKRVQQQPEKRVSGTRMKSQSGRERKAVDSKGRSRGLQSEDCSAPKTRRKPVATMNDTTESTAKKSLLFIGLDVHQESIAVAIAEEGRGGDHLAPFAAILLPWRGCSLASSRRTKSRRVNCGLSTRRPPAATSSRVGLSSWALPASSSPPR